MIEVTNAGLLCLSSFTTDIDLAGGIVAHQYHGQARYQSFLSQFGSARSDTLSQAFGGSAAVDDRGAQGNSVCDRSR
jgi:hypothetical protein